MTTIAMLLRTEAMFISTGREKERFLQKGFHLNHSRSVAQKEKHVASDSQEEMLPLIVSCSQVLKSLYVSVNHLLVVHESHSGFPLGFSFT